jgi:hypothetical protein
MGHRLLRLFVKREPEPRDDIRIHFPGRPLILLPALRRFDGGFREWWRGLVDPVEVEILWEIVKVMWSRVREAF